MYSLPDSDQLELFEAMALEESRLPWGGKSPRGLTRGSGVLYSRREPREDACCFADVNQVDMFRRRLKKAPWRYEGAPLLIGG